MRLRSLSGRHDHFERELTFGRDNVVTPSGVIDGEMTVEVGGKTLVLRPGSLGHLPRNTVHSFKVTNKAVCHVLNYYTRIEGESGRSVN